MTSTLWTGSQYIPAPRFQLGDAVLAADEAWDDWNIYGQETLYSFWCRGHVVGLTYDFDGTAGSSVFVDYTGWRYVVAVVESHSGRSHQVKTGWEEFKESDLRPCRSLARDAQSSSLVRYRAS